MKKIGFLVNPVAGLGGRAGFKGSDSFENQQKALAAGYKKTAGYRAEQCLSRVKNLDQCQLYAPVGEMGGQILERLQIPYQSIGEFRDVTTRADTIWVIQKMVDLQMDLIVFCGGDGTARDVCEACGDSVAVLGIPAGVKMYSGCFSVNPIAGGELLSDFISGKPCVVEQREVMDLDESCLGRYSVCAKLYGYLSVVDLGARLQGPKVASVVETNETELLVAALADQMQRDVLYIIGPGSTTYQLKQKICGNGTLIGVDVVRNGELICLDADEKKLMQYLAEFPSAKIIVTCIGGAGFLFGRGNPQISASVIRRVGRENLILAVTKSKLLSLHQKPMYVDTTDPELDQSLSGYYKITLSEGESTVYKVQSI